MVAEQQISKEECKRIQIQILDEIAMICKQSGLNYYLAYGTLLGAIRHKGFIPWDDDIDIYMSRDEYEKLLTIMKSPDIKMPHWLELYDGDKDGYYYPFAKAVDNTTIAKMEDNLTKHGIWIDIFPVDRLPDSARKRYLFVKAGKALRDVIIAMTTDFTAQKKDSKRAVKRLISIIASAIGKKRIYHFTEWYYQKYRNSGSDMFACLSSSYGTKEIMHEAELFSPTEVEFESKPYQATEHWEQYLTKLYGEYSVLPPVEQRRVHSITAFRCQPSANEGKV